MGTLTFLDGSIVPRVATLKYIELKYLLNR